MRTDVEERTFWWFWNHVLISDGCWEWRRSRNNLGYGTLRHKGQPTYAHRVAWLFWHGDDPGEFCVLHHCDNPPCVRPDHLFLGTRGDNSQDMVAKGRGALQRPWAHPNEKKTHCPQGHPYDRVGRRGDGRTFRSCSICARENVRRHKEKIRTYIPDPMAGAEKENGVD